jgi:hypothetical protein
MLERDAMVSAPATGRVGRRHQTEAPGAAAQNRIREISIRTMRHACKADEADEQQQIADRRGTPDEAEALDGVGERRGRPSVV